MTPSSAKLFACTTPVSHHCLCAANRHPLRLLTSHLSQLQQTTLSPSSVYPLPPAPAAGVELHATFVVVNLALLSRDNSSHPLLHRLVEWTGLGTEDE
jgi:hypothetical protein